MTSSIIAVEFIPYTVFRNPDTEYRVYRVHRILYTVLTVYRTRYTVFTGQKLPVSRNRITRNRINYTGLGGIIQLEVA